MELTTLEQVARTVAQVGAIGLVVGMLNIVALRLVRLEEVPGPMRGRIRWWTLHNSAFLAVSGLVLVAGLAMLLAA